MTPAAYAELTALMERYFDGLHRADSTILRTTRNWPMSAPRRATNST